jgi:hypothetical protein
MPAAPPPAAASWAAPEEGAAGVGLLPSGHDRPSVWGSISSEDWALLMRCAGQDSLMGLDAELLRPGSRAGGSPAEPLVLSPASRPLLPLNDLASVFSSHGEVAGSSPYGGRTHQARRDPFLFTEADPALGAVQALLPQPFRSGPVPWHGQAPYGTDPTQAAVASVDCWGVGCSSAPAPRRLHNALNNVWSSSSHARAPPLSAATSAAPLACLQQAAGPTPTLSTASWPLLGDCGYTGATLSDSTGVVNGRAAAGAVLDLKSMAPAPGFQDFGAPVRDAPLVGRTVQTPCSATDQTALAPISSGIPQNPAECQGLLTSSTTLCGAYQYQSTPVCPSNSTQVAHHSMIGTHTQPRAQPQQPVRKSSRKRSTVFSVAALDDDLSSDGLGDEGDDSQPCIVESGRPRQTGGGRGGRGGDRGDPEWNSLWKERGSMPKGRATCNVFAASLQKLAPVTTAHVAGEASQQQVAGALPVATGTLAATDLMIAAPPVSGAEPRGVAIDLNAALEGGRPMAKASGGACPPPHVVNHKDDPDATPSSHPTTAPTRPSPLAQRVNFFAHGPSATPGSRSPFPSRPGSALHGPSAPSCLASPTPTPLTSLSGSQATPNTKKTNNRNRRLFMPGSGLKDGAMVGYIHKASLAVLLEGTVKLYRLDGHGDVSDDPGGILCSHCNEVRCRL